MSERTRIALLLILAVLVYANTLRCDYVFDDEIYITGNRLITHPTAGSVFSASNHNVFRPMTFASFAVLWKVGRGRPLLFHATNVLLHAVVILLLYLVFRKLLESVPKGATMAFVAAMLFAVHPIHSEAVAWASAQSELLAAGFLLGAWLLHLNDCPISAALCLVLALLSKESAVALLPLVLIGDYLRGKFKPAINYLGITFATIAYVPLLWLVQGRRFGPPEVAFADNPLRYLPAGWRMLNALRIIWKYVGLQLYPATLSCDYSYNAILLYTKWNRVLPAAIGALFAVGIWAWALRKKKTEWALAGAIYFAGFAATANIFVLTGTIMAERLAYFPSAGFCLLVAAIWTQLEARRRALGWALLIIAVVTLSGRTMVRNWDWRSSFALYSAAVRAVPGSSKMHADFGIANFYVGRLEGAREELETSVRIYPEIQEAVAVLGLVEADQGHDEEARRTMEKAISMTRRSDFNYRAFSANLAAELIKVNKDDEALEVVNQLLRQWPDYWRAWYYRAVIEYRRGETAAARSDVETCLRLEPTDQQAQSLSSALTTLKPPGNAVK